MGMVQVSQYITCLVQNWSRGSWDFLEFLLLGQVFSLGGDGSQHKSSETSPLEEAFPGQIAKCCLLLLCGGLDSVEVNKLLILQQHVWG